MWGKNIIRHRVLPSSIHRSLRLSTIILWLNISLGFNMSSGVSFMLPGHVKRLKKEYWDRKGKEIAVAGLECEKKRGVTGACGQGGYAV